MFFTTCIPRRELRCPLVETVTQGAWRNLVLASLVDGYSRPHLWRRWGIFLFCQVFCREIEQIFFKSLGVKGKEETLAPRLVVRLHIVAAH